MNPKNPMISQLISKLESISKRQDDFEKEIVSLRADIEALNGVEQALTIGSTDETQLITDPQFEANADTEATGIYTLHDAAELIPTPVLHQDATPKVKSDLEKFIGENLLNKIGIAITVIGVGIGAKYSIDNQLISPLTRIILGYLAALVLLGFGIKLKPKYESYSAVLVGGAVAIMYFITYLGYGLYGLIPQLTAFILMILFTVFTVVAAISYNRQILAHIGLVGAYAVPFLLGDGSGDERILFAYMAVINIGIVSIAFRKYWKPLFYSAFGLTWLIYILWYVNEFQVNEWGVAMPFLALFFSIFYLTFLAYKLGQSEALDNSDVILLLTNSFIFYGIGYLILDKNALGAQLLGGFTLVNAIIHFIVSSVIFRRKLADRSLLYAVSGLVLVFVTISIPVQLDGNWVTLIWVGMAAVLFWVGRTKGVPFYEKMSFLLMLLAFLSLIHDWTTLYSYYNFENPDGGISPIFNAIFLTSILFAGAFSFIHQLNQNKRFPQAFAANSLISTFCSYGISTVLLLSIYYAFRLEIANYWLQRYEASALTIGSSTSEYPDYYWNNDLIHFKNIWIINYTLFFAAVLFFVNTIKVKNPTLGLVTLSLLVVTLCTFLVQGLTALSNLRDSYLNSSESANYQAGIANLAIRYISFGFVALSLVLSQRYTRMKPIRKDAKVAFDLLLHTTVLWITSNELIHWITMAGTEDAFKFGLSILWGTYSLFLIGLGIWQRKKHLRIGGICLFAATLLKLFFYDIANLDTIAKTIVFVALGLLLLIISFLYNKFKLNISDDAG